MKQVPYKQRVTDIVMKHIKTLGKTDRERAKMAGIAHTAIGKLEKGTGMTLTTLEKIVNKFPELAAQIGAVFYHTEEPVSINTDKNITGGGKAAGLMETIKLLEERIEDLKQDKRDLQKDKEDLRKRLSDLEEGKAVAR